MWQSSEGLRVPVAICWIQPSFSLPNSSFQSEGLGEKFGKGSQDSCPIFNKRKFKTSPTVTLGKHSNNQSDVIQYHDDFFFF